MNRNTIMTVAARILATVFTCGATVVLARCLGPEGQGRYFIAITFAAMIVQLANLGIHSSNTYFLARNSTRFGPLLANSLWISVVFGGLVAALAVLATIAFQSAGWVVTVDPSTLCLGAILVPPRMFYLFGSNLLIGLEKIRAFNYLQVGSAFLLLCTLAAVGSLNGGEIAFLAATCIVWGVLSMGLFFMLWRDCGVRLTFHREVFRAGVRYSAKVFIACLLGFLVLRSNVFLLDAFCGDTEVGLYSVAAQAADVLNLVPATLAMVLFPQMVKEERHSWHKMLYGLAEIAIFMLLSCGVAATFAQAAVQLVLGDRFRGAAEVLLYMLPGVFFLGLISIVSQYLASISFPRRVLDTWLIAFVLQVVLGVLLIPKYAGVGAAIALSITYSVTFVLQICLAYTWANHRKAKFAEAKKLQHQLST